MRQPQVLDWQGVTDEHLDRLQVRLEAGPEPELDRIKTIPIPFTIKDKILSVIIPGNILSCKGIVFKMEKKYQEKFDKDTIGARLPQLVREGKINRAMVNGKFYYWKPLT